MSDRQRLLLSPYRLPTHHQVYLNEDEMAAWLTANADLPQTPKVLALVQRLGQPVTAALPVQHMLRTGEVFTLERCLYGRAAA